MNFTSPSSHPVNTYSQAPVSPQVFVRGEDEGCLLEISKHDGDQPGANEELESLLRKTRNFGSPLP